MQWLLTINNNRIYSDKHVMTYWSLMMSLHEEEMMYPAEEAMTAWTDDTNLGT